MQTVWWDTRRPGSRTSAKLVRTNRIGRDECFLFYRSTLNSVLKKNDIKSRTTRSSASGHGPDSFRSKSPFTPKNAGFGPGSRAGPTFLFPPQIVATNLQGLPGVKSHWSVSNTDRDELEPTEHRTFGPNARTTNQSLRPTRFEQLGVGGREIESPRPESKAFFCPIVADRLKPRPFRFV
jgi:hypothetical protein